MLSYVYHLMTCYVSDIPVDFSYILHIISQYFIYQCLFGHYVRRFREERRI